jgi:hypothetical protein
MASPVTRLWGSCGRMGQEAGHSVVRAQDLAQLSALKYQHHTVPPTRGTPAHLQSKRWGADKEGLHCPADKRILLRHDAFMLLLSYPANVACR